MNRHVDKLLARARSLLALPGGPPGELSRAEIGPAARAVLELHEGLIGERALARPETYRGARLGAYLLWWWPETYAKTQAALRLAPIGYSAPWAPPVAGEAGSSIGCSAPWAPPVAGEAGSSVPRAPRILDVGSGPAAAALAAMDLLGGDAVCFDASEAALEEARALGIRQVARELPAGPFDLTVAANVLSELTSALSLVRKLTGVIVLIEPALRETGRALLQLRDTLLASGEFRALAPCLTQKPCPALASPRDWCTAEVRWDAPRFVRQLADATGLRADEMLSYAPLILARAAPEPAPDVWRVVGVPPPEKGKRRVWVCSDQGRVAAVRLDKEAAPENAPFEDLRRGDLVRLRGLQPRGDGLRVVPGATVERL